MTDENAHARGVLAQLRASERDADLPEDLRESAAERAEEIEEALAGDDGRGGGK